MNNKKIKSNHTFNYRGAHMLITGPGPRTSKVKISLTPQEKEVVMADIKKGEGLRKDALDSLVLINKMLEIDPDDQRFVARKKEFEYFLTKIVEKLERLNALLNI